MSINSTIYFHFSYHGRMARGDHGLPKVLPGPAMPNPFTPCRLTTPETAYSCFRGGLPARLAASGHLLPLWTPHAIRLCLSAGSPLLYLYFLSICFNQVHHYYLDFFPKLACRPGDDTLYVYIRDKVNLCNMRVPWDVYLKVKKYVDIPKYFAFGKKK
jgi:hypothetical protein